MLIAVLCASCGRKVVTENYSIIPQPAEMTMDKGYFTLSSSTKCYAGGVGQNDQSVKFIFSHLRQWHFNPVLIGTPEANSLQLIINETSDSELGDEGYTIDVGKDGIVIAANSERGLFYGFQTFVQMLPEDVSVTRYSKISIPFCHIRDYPQYEWRGSLLDVSRHFFGVSQVKKHLDLMAQYKLNKFHWHLTDDQGWRIEIDRYPQLNDIGSWRVDRTHQPWGQETPAHLGEEPTYGGFYTQEDIADIVAYAAQRHIEVIPEIDLPSHASAILAAYPQLACDDYPYTVALGPYWPPKAILCLGNDETMQFVSDIIDEVIQLFPSPYIHIGGDVPYRDNWEECPRCQALMRKQGLANENELQGWFLSHVGKMLESKGRMMIGWDDIMDCPLTTDAVVMAWRGDTTAFAAALRNTPVISASPSYCNLECYQADSNHQPTAFPLYITLHQAYQYDPIPRTLTENAQPYVWGGECMLWTDYINNYSQAEYQLLPRLCAIAECLWTPLDRKDWSHFQKKIEHHKARLLATGHNTCLGSFKPTVTKTPESDGFLVTITTETSGSYVYYTTDGSDPTPESPLYTSPLHLPNGTLLRTLTLYNGKAQEGIYDFKL